MSASVRMYVCVCVFSVCHSMIKQSIVDVESMMRLLDEPTEIKDAPDARELVVSRGDIEFRNVVFQYSNKVPVTITHTQHKRHSTSVLRIMLVILN